MSLYQDAEGSRRVTAQERSPPGGLATRAALPRGTLHAAEGRRTDQKEVLTRRMDGVKGDRIRLEDDLLRDARVDARKRSWANASSWTWSWSEIYGAPDARTASTIPSTTPRSTTSPGECWRTDANLIEALAEEIARASPNPAPAWRPSRAGAQAGGAHRGRPLGCRWRSSATRGSTTLRRCGEQPVGSLWSRHLERRATMERLVWRGSSWVTNRVQRAPWRSAPGRSDEGLLLRWIVPAPTRRCVSGQNATGPVETPCARAHV